MGGGFLVHKMHKFHFTKFYFHVLIGDGICSSLPIYLSYIFHIWFTVTTQMFLIFFLRRFSFKNKIQNVGNFILEFRRPQSNNFNITFNFLPDLTNVNPFVVTSVCDWILTNEWDFKIELLPHFSYCNFILCFLVGKTFMLMHSTEAMDSLELSWDWRKFQDKQI